MAQFEVLGQYAHLGVHFQPTNDRFIGPDFGSFSNDGWGLDGNGPVFNDVIIHFDQPHFAIGADFPGSLDFKLYWKGQMFAGAKLGALGFGNFGGIVSPHPFDMVIFEQPSGNVFIDDLHFAVPTPAAGVLLLTLAYQRRKPRA